GPSKTEEGKADLSERWNVQALGGGSSRQDKFMRLLGGKKHGATTSNAGGNGGREHLDIGHVVNDLERQFEAGIRMKFESSGQRKGLGA
ncbi:small acidic protein-like domain-containing protein, partial [Phialemonium atrogriseum]